MNPQSHNQQNGINLPPPMLASEQAPTASAATPEVIQTQNELPKMAAEQLPQVAQSAPPSDFSLPMPTMPAPMPAVSVTTQSSSAALPDDGDLIEKEWVNKAKAIVDRNRDDPYKQSEELTVFKSDYMKQRYNKTIKASS